MEMLELVCDSWDKQILRDLSLMQKTGLMCDVKICLTEDMVVPTHSCVLSAASPFLKSILNGTEAPELDFRDFPSKLIQQVIQFIYTGQLSVTKREVHVLHKVATHLCIPALTAMLQHVIAAEQNVNHQSSVRAEMSGINKPLENKMTQSTEHLNADSNRDDGGTPCTDKAHCINSAINMDVQKSDDWCYGDQHPYLNQKARKIVNDLSDTEEDRANEDTIHAEPLHADNTSINHDQLRKTVPVARPVVDYYCEQCNVGYTSDIHYHKHMQRKHGKALPVEIYVMIEKEQEDRLGKDGSCKESGQGVVKDELVKKNTNLETDNSRSPLLKTCVRRKKGTGKKKGKFVCATCRRSFKTVSSWKLHETIHRNERPYKCNKCGRAFTQAGNLKVHERSHTGEKPFQCSQCGRGFGQSSHLKCHMRMHTGEKPYVCSICGAAFSSNTNLKSHQRRHTGEKPYKCTTCGRAFSQLGNLNAHQRCHAGIKPYHCQHCDKAFTVLCNYQRHLKRHMPNRPYHCPDCGKGFVNKSEMRSHQRHKHMIVFDPGAPQLKGIHFPRKNVLGSISAAVI